MGKASVSSFYSADVRFLKEIIGKESEFEKPYLDEDYRKMHFDFPTPDWPPFPGFSMPEIPGPSEKASACAIVCYEPLDCDEPIWCHPSIWCGGDLDCTLCHWEVEGAALGYSVHQMTKGWTWGIDVWLDATLVESDGKALIKICMKDPCGNICCHESEIDCCVPEVPLTFDDANTADTIAPNGTITISVLGGTPPFIWTTTSTGYTFTTTITSVRQNNLTSDSGTCGVDYDAVASLKITDACGVEVTTKIRNTGGEWNAGTENCNLYRSIYNCSLIDEDTWIYLEGWCPGNPGNCGSDCYLGQIGPCGEACDPNCIATSCYKKTYLWVCP
jgi:hypothetical protein